jgi:hypothetical protein
MTHHVFAVSATDKQAVIHELAAGHERSLLFMRTKHTAKKLAKQLTAAGIPAVELHGNLSQGMRERNLSAFTEGTTRVLVATDIAARGIHVDDVALVVHVDPPTEHKAYLHRSGRTARAGAGGTVVTLALPEQARDVRTLAKQAGIAPTTVAVRPGAPEITSVAGPAAPYVEPAVVVAQPPDPGRRRLGPAGGPPLPAGAPVVGAHEAAADRHRLARGPSSRPGPASRSPWPGGVPLGRSRRSREAGLQPAARVAGRRLLRPPLRSLLAALLDVAPHEVLGVRLEHLVDLVEQVVELRLQRLTLLVGRGDLLDGLLPTGGCFPLDLLTFRHAVPPLSLGAQPVEELGRCRTAVQ